MKKPFTLESFDTALPGWRPVPTGAEFGAPYGRNLAGSLNPYKNLEDIFSYDITDQSRRQYDVMGRMLNISDFTYGTTREQEKAKRQNLAAKVGLGTLRAATDLIEPLNLIKDVFDAAVAGALDPETTMGDRLRRLNLGAYFDAYNPALFFNGKSEIAPRATTGKEIMELMGSDNKIFNAGAGFAWDVLADPLLLSAGIGATGRIVGAFGKVSPAAARASTALLNSAKAVDEWMSIGGYYRKLGVVAPELKGFLDSRTEEMIRFVADPSAPWNTRTASIIDHVLPKKTAARAKFGEFGDQVFDMFQRSQQGADEFFEQTMELVLNAEGKLLGIQTKKNFFDEVNKVLSSYRTNEKVIVGIPKKLHAAAQREAVAVVDKLGLGAIDNVDDVIEPLKGIFSTAKSQGLKGNTNILDEAVNRIKTLAEAAPGVDAIDFAKKFRQYTLDYAQIDAFVGFKKSGMELIQNTLYKNLSQMGASATEAQRIWEDMFAAGISGKWDDFLDRATTISPKLEQATTGLDAATARANYKESIARMNRQFDETKNRITSRAMQKINVQKNRLAKLTSNFNSKDLDEAQSAWNATKSQIDNLKMQEAELTGNLNSYLPSQVSEGRNLVRQGLTQKVDNVRKQINELTTQLATQKDAITSLKQASLTRNPKAQQIEQTIQQLEQQLNLDIAKAQERHVQNLQQTRSFLNESSQAARADAGISSTPTVRTDPVSTSILQKRGADGIGSAASFDTNFTLREILSNITDFQAMQMNTFFQGITQGHMRRAYGLFLSRGGADSYIKGIQRGKLVVSSMLDDTRLNKVLDNNKAQLVSSYIKDLGQGKDFVFNRKDLIIHLENNGLKPQEAIKVVKDLIADANPKIKDFVKDLGDISAKYEDIGAAVRGNQLVGFGQNFEKARKEIDTEFLTKLGELTNPLTSIIETASAARQRIPFADFMSNLYLSAKDNGLVSHTYVEGYKKLGSSANWGAFADQYVDPFIAQTMTQAMLNPHKRAGIGTHALNVITSSYLAAPNVIFGNAIGGIVTSGMAGNNPVDVITSMFRNFKPLADYTGKDIHSPMIDLLKQHLDLNLSSQITQLFAKDLGNIRLEKAGLEAEGIEALVGRLGKFYEDQLKAPGIGNLRAKWAGLEGFQWTENWLKVSNFDVGVSDALRRAGKQELIGKWDEIAASTDKAVQDAVKYGAEKARIAVFDYSEMPDSIKFMQRTGIVIFPGFQYFSVGRTVSALLNKPGTIGAFDRIPDAITNAAMDEDQKWQLYAAMDDWMKDEKGTPAWIRQDEQGNQRVSVIPLSQIIPTSTFADTRWVESLVSGGIYKSLIEGLFAYLRGDGEAVFSGKYGQRVFDETDGAGTRLAKTIEFIASNITPTLTRKLGTTPQDIRNINEGEPSQGLIGAIRGTQIKVPTDMGAYMYRQDELDRGKALRGITDEVMSLFLRAPQVYAFGGRLDAVNRQYQISKDEKDRMVRELDKKYKTAMKYNEDERAIDYLDKANQVEQEWLNRWTGTQP